jgi:uroporphyrinogen-III decarboxylase
MSPRLYDDLVVRYDQPLIALVHEYGKIAHVHCHGKVREALDKIIAMGADLLDPVEPPPDGDIEFWEAKEKARGKTVLIGNIEFRHLEFATPAEIDAQVREAIQRGGKKGMILGVSATAITSISDRYRDNAIQYIESGLRYGTLNGNGQ